MSIEVLLAVCAGSLVVLAGQATWAFFRTKSALNTAVKDLQNTVVYEYRAAESHEILAIPIGLLEWEEHDITFRPGLGPNDLKLKNKFDSLIKDGFEIVSFSVEDKKAYFVFKKVRLKT